MTATDPHTALIHELTAERFGTPVRTDRRRPQRHLDPITPDQAWRNLCDLHRALNAQTDDHHEQQETA
jgi:hypothetical protein